MKNVIYAIFAQAVLVDSNTTANYIDIGVATIMFTMFLIHQF